MRSPLPAGWQKSCLEEVTKALGGGTPSKSNPSYWLGGTVPWVSPKDMKTHLITGSEDRVTEAALDRLSVVPAGSVLVVVRSGILSRTLPVALTAVPVTVNQDMRAFVPMAAISPSYLAWQLLAMEREILEECSKDGTTVASIEGPAFAHFSLAIAPAAEQTRIVAKLEELLSDLDAGVKELKAAQKKLQQYRQSLLKAAVEGALTADWRAAQRRQNAPIETGAQLLERILTERRARWEGNQLAKFKEQGKAPPKDWQDKYPEPVRPVATALPALPERWFYADLTTFLPSDKTGTKTGPFGSLLMKHEHLQSGIPVIGIENIDKSGFVHGSKIRVSIEKASQLSDYDLVEGDVVISRSGTVGEVCVIPSGLGEARFSTNIMRVRPNQDVMSSEFFSTIFRGSPFVLQQISTLCSGSTRDFLNTEILRSLTFPVPPIDEQRASLEALRERLAEAELLDAAISRAFTQATAQRQNILRAAFSGQLVPQDPNDEPASVLLERIRAERAANAVITKRRGRKAKEAA